MRSMTLEHLDACPVTGRASQLAIERDQGRAQRLRESHMGRIVGR
jgi:hypothetical protein